MCLFDQMHEAWDPPRRVTKHVMLKESLVPTVVSSITKQMEDGAYKNGRIVGLAPPERARVLGEAIDFVRGHFREESR